MKSILKAMMEKVSSLSDEVHTLKASKGIFDETPHPIPTLPKDAVNVSAGLIINPKTTKEPSVNVSDSKFDSDKESS